MYNTLTSKIVYKIRKAVPPLKFDEAPTYAKFSMLITSMTGLTTRLRSCNRKNNESWPYGEAVKNKEIILRSV